MLPGTRDVKLTNLFQYLAHFYLLEEEKRRKKKKKKPIIIPFLITDVRRKGFAILQGSLSEREVSFTEEKEMTSLPHGNTALAWPGGCGSSRAAKGQTQCPRTLWHGLPNALSGPSPSNTHTHTHTWTHIFVLNLTLLLVSLGQWFSVQGTCTSSISITWEFTVPISDSLTQKL